MNEMLEMMTKNQINEREHLEIFNVEQLVSQNHLGRKEVQAYEKRLQKGINLDRDKNGKKNTSPDKFGKELCKNEKGFVLANIVTQGNVHAGYADFCCH